MYLLSTIWYCLLSWNQQAKCFVQEFNVFSYPDFCLSVTLFVFNFRRAARSLKALTFQFVWLVPSGSPLNIRITSRSASSLTIVWDPPEKDKQNGHIISYTLCVSHLENGHCFQKMTISERKWVVRNLNPYIKYYVRILASTKAGPGNYSESEVLYTNGGKHSVIGSKRNLDFPNYFLSK